MYESEVAPARLNATVTVPAVQLPCPASLKVSCRRDAPVRFSTQEKAELSYTVLSDTGAALASTLGITFAPSEEGLAAQRALGVDIRTTRADDGTVLPMPTVPMTSGLSPGTCTSRAT